MPNNIQDIAEKAAHALFASIHNDLDPKDAHDLGGWSSLHHSERFDSIRNAAHKVAESLASIVEEQNKVSPLKATLTTIKAIVDDYRHDLGSVPPNEFPKGWDSVVVFEHLTSLAHDLHELDKGADIPQRGIKGISTSPAFLGSYWASVEMLGNSMPETFANRHFFNHASKMLAKDIEDCE